MEIVGSGRDRRGDPDVETIEVWFSERRRIWQVERRDIDGDQIGLSHRCHHEDEASACVAEWLRAHTTAYVVGPHPLSSAERRVLARGIARRRVAA